MNMGTAAGGGRGGRGGAGRGNPGALPAQVEAATPGALPSNPAAAPPANAATPAPQIPTIGPDGATGNVLFAWDPVARKERWRAAGASAGPFSGGSLTTAGNLVFSSVNDKLLVFRADTGEKLLELATGLTQMGPPITFLIDGKQYITVAGGPERVSGGTEGPGGATTQTGAAATPARPGHLLAFVLDGNASLPGAPK